MLMWLLLPPIFVVCVGMALAAPWFARKPKAQDAEEPNAIPKHAWLITRADSSAHARLSQ